MPLSHDEKNHFSSKMGYLDVTMQLIVLLLMIGASISGCVSNTVATPYPTYTPVPSPTNTPNPEPIAKTIPTPTVTVDIEVVNPTPIYVPVKKVRNNAIEEIFYTI